MAFNFGLPQALPQATVSFPFAVASTTGSPSPPAFGFGFHSPAQQEQQGFSQSGFQFQPMGTEPKGVVPAPVSKRGNTFAGLTTKELATLLCKGSEAAWIDSNGGTCMAPWESLLLSLLLRRNPDSKDVALTLTVAKSLFLGSNELRRQRPVVSFETKSFRLWRYEPSIPWRSTPLCEVLGQPSPKAGLHCANIGILPPKDRLIHFTREVLVEAARGDYFDIFWLAVEYRKLSRRYQIVNRGSAPRMNSPSGLLSALVETSNPSRYFSLVSPQKGVFLPTEMDGILLFQNVSLPDALRCAAPNRVLFDLVCQYVVEREGRLTACFLKAASSVNATTLEIALKYFDAHNDPDRFEFFLSTFHNSIEIATKMIDHFRGVPNVVESRQQQSDLLLASSNLGGCRGFGTDAMVENERQLAALSLLLERCPAIGFDVAEAVRDLAQRSTPVEFSLEALRYLFSVHLALPKTIELLRPKDLLTFFRTQEAMKFASEELGYPVPDPASIELEELLIGALSNRQTFSLAMYLFRRCLPELSCEVQTKCLELICADSRFQPEPAIVELLEYFIEKGWLNETFRFGSGEGLQHRIRLIGNSGAGSALQGSQAAGKSADLVHLLRVKLQFDLTEVNQTGEFPLSLALQRGEWNDVRYLLREGLIPANDVMLKYRYKAPRGDIHTFLTLLCMKTRGLSSVGAFELFKDMIRGIGVELVQELSRTPVQRCACLLDESTYVASPAFAFACEILPVEYVKYLVEEIHISGCSVPEVRAILQGSYVFSSVKNYLLTLIGVTEQVVTPAPPSSLTFW